MPRFSPGTSQWISARETNYVISWIETFPTDSIIHLFNNWQETKRRQKSAQGFMGKLQLGSTIPLVQRKTTRIAQKRGTLLSVECLGFARVVISSVILE